MGNTVRTPECRTWQNGDELKITSLMQVKMGTKKKPKGKIQNQTVTGQLAARHHEAPGTKSKDKLTIIE